MSTSGFTGGSLKIKGGDIVKKKKKHSSGMVVTDGASHAKDELRKMLHGHEVTTTNEDRRTEAEKRHEEKTRKLEEERLKKMAGKSHRERIKDFNDHLTNLSEHHDIPKVGPG